MADYKVPMSFLVILNFPTCRVRTFDAMYQTESGNITLPASLTTKSNCSIISDVYIHTICVITKTKSK